MFSSKSEYFYTAMNKVKNSIHTKVYISLQILKDLDVPPALGQTKIAVSVACFTVYIHSKFNT